MNVSRETISDDVPLSAQEFFHLLRFPVSRETEERFILYEALLQKWQKAINLVGPTTMRDPWRRHFLDSAQIFPYLPLGECVDFGSGAGFPGLVLALLSQEQGGRNFTLIESDQRKAAFLAEIIRQTGAPARLIMGRIESAPAFKADAITARALAPLVRLFPLVEKFVKKETEIFFLKGAKGEEELTEVAKKWRMQTERIASLSDPAGVLFHFRELSR